MNIDNSGLLPSLPNVSPKVALVLSSGGVKGMVHIGCIEALREAEIPIDMIIGCSAGALIGGLYASEMDTQHIYDLATKILPERYSYRLFGLPSIRGGISGNGIFSTSGMESYLKSSMKNQTFEDLGVPFRAVATNLNTGKLDEFFEGDLIKPLCASSALPGFFTPVKIGDNSYSDGGIMSTTPVRVAKKIGAKIIIACNIKTPFKEMEKVDNALFRSYAILRNISKSQEVKDADVLIDVTPEAGLLFIKKKEAYELYKLGKEATQRVIPDIHRLIQKRL